MVNNQINAIPLQTSSENGDAKAAARAKLLEKINGGPAEEKAVQSAPPPQKDEAKIAEVKATIAKLEGLLADDPENEKLISIRDAWQEALIKLDPPKDRFRKFTTADGKEIVWDREKGTITAKGVVYLEDELLDIHKLDPENQKKVITLKEEMNLRPSNIPWEEPPHLQKLEFKP